MTTWRCYLIDDLSTDGTVELVRELIKGDDRFTLIVNTKRHGQAGNYAQVHARPEIDDEDIMVEVDGDDCVPDPETLTRILAAYADGRAWMTWGSFAYINDSGKVARGCAGPVDADNARDGNWHLSHIRTWRAFLFRAVKDEDLRDPETGWYHLAGADTTFMFPMAEMAGCGHARFLKQQNYWYENLNPENEWRTHGKEQNRTERLVRAMPRYPKLVRSA